MYVDEKYVVTLTTGIDGSTKGYQHHVDSERSELDELRRYLIVGRTVSTSRESEKAEEKAKSFLYEFNKRKVNVVRDGEYI